MQVCNISNILLKYHRHLDFVDIEAIVDLRLQSVKKYWRYAV